jgi:hypothetical protein
MMSPSSTVLVALLLAAACSALQASPTSSSGATCISKCWSNYNAEIQDCVNTASMKDALAQPLSGSLYAPASAGARYTGPQVDVLQTVRAQCRANVGTARLDACRKACSAAPVVVRPVSRPVPVLARPVGNNCEAVCRARYQPNTLGRLRCMYNC